MDFITIIDGKAVVSAEAMSIPIVKKVYMRDKTRHKKSFEMWMRFIYHSFNKKSLYKNYLPKEREQKVVEMIFPDLTTKYFRAITGLNAFIEFYIDSQMSFREKLYRRLLKDIEEMVDKLSKTELTKTTRVKGNRDITFFSKTEKKEVTENIDIDVRISIDNTPEKEKSMVMIDKLLARDKVLRKMLKEEEIANELNRSSSRRLYDQ